MSEHSANPSATAATGRTRAVKAVIPAAGLATRFLPATKAVPKELLPVVDRPVLQYIVEEAAQAGIDDVLLITGRGKTSMVDHFDRRPDLEARLEEKATRAAGRGARGRASWPRSTPAGSPSSSVSATPSGTPSRTSATSPSRCCSATSSSNPSEPLLPAMLELQARTGGIVLAFFEVDPAETKRYGIASVAPAEPELTDIGEVVEVTGLVEKPQPEDAPSNLAVLGRYVLPGGIFDAIRRTEPGSGGEIQLTDAMELLLHRGRAGARDRLPGHPLRHRHAAGLPPDGGAARLPSARTSARSSARWLAEFVNSEADRGPDESRR